MTRYTQFFRVKELASLQLQWKKKEQQFTSPHPPALPTPMQFKSIYKALQILVTKLLQRKHIRPLPYYGSVSILEEPQRHTWKERKCCPTPPQSYQIPNTELDLIEILVQVLCACIFNDNYMYLTQQIAAERCLISSKIWWIGGWSERLDVSSGG